MAVDMRSFRQDALYFFGVANLLMLPFWTLAFARNGMPTDDKFIDNYYELSQIFTHVDYAAALLLTAVMGFVLWVLDKGLRRASVKLHRCYEMLAGIGGLAMLAMTIWVVADPPSGAMRINDGWVVPFLTIGISVILATSLVAWRLPFLLLTVLRFGIYATTPIFLVLALNTYVAMTKVGAPADGLFSADRSLAPVIQTPSTEPRTKSKIIVIFFDMWDYPVTFETRPDWLKLPNIDKISAESFFATKALSASRSTRIALPSMVTGRKVVWSWPTRNDDMSLVFAENYGAVSWRDNPGLFRALRDANYNTSVIATAYHPYCRMFREYIADCWIDDTSFDFEHRTIFNRMDNVITEVLRYIPGINRLLFEPKKRQHPNWGVHLHLAFEEKVQSVSVDPNIDFVFVHWLLPHPPFIRNHKTGEWQYFDEHSSKDFYFGNLQALDMSIGTLRKTMEKAGQWQDATILLTTDHGYTLPDWPEQVPTVDQRIPFILKLPGAHAPLRSQKPFLMTSLPKLIEGLTMGKVTGPQDIEAFLDLPNYYH
jgi:hypothetical protein